MSGKKEVKTVMEKIVEDVAILEKLETDQVTQFSELALNFLQTGANKKMYKSAAKHIGASVEEVGRCIMGISKLLINGIRRKLVSRMSFGAFMDKVGVPETAAAALAAFFVKNREAIFLCVSQLSMQLPRFQNLDWRLDIEVSRRMAHNVFQPNFMFKLDTIDSQQKSQYMQVDMKTVKFLREQLKAALQESDSVHQKRVTKYVR
mmetsp:Transcript_36121/g.52955  ORF Transcript_36121/g.52955 Transcript_36121/m.52955 type:complete len:205 (+) Transcript_36121:119-733(+)